MGVGHVLKLAMVAALLGIGGLSQPAWAEVVVRTATGQEVKLYEESHALVIGVSNYTAGWGKLPSIPGEMSRLIETLKAQEFKITPVMNPDARQLREAVEDFIYTQGVAPNNRLLIFFAGHGWSPDKEGNKGYLVPTDAPRPNKDMPGFLRKAVSMDQVLAWARDIQSKHVLFLFDSCFSGSVFTARNDLSQPPPISRLTVEPVREFITAGSADEEVPSQSVFTPMVIDALTHRLGDLNKDGYVSGMELGLHLQQELPKHVSQTPQFGKISDHKLSRGDFVFVVGGEAPPPPPPNTREARAWQAAEKANTVAGYRAFLKHFPDGEHKAEAEVKLASLEPPPPPEARTWLDPVTDMEFIRIRGDCFQIGMSDEEKESLKDHEKYDVWFKDAEKRHKVCIKNFWLGKYEVTVKEFRMFVDTTRYITDAEQNAGGKKGCFSHDDKDGKREWRYVAGRHWQNPGYEQQDNFPVVCISWRDAHAFVDWLNKGSKHGRFRLPTEAEWEFAARGGTTTQRFWGDDPNQACQYANVADITKDGAWDWTKPHTCSDGYYFSAPVGQFKANPFGLHDMLGNVWEWTCSAYANPYNGSEEKCAKPKNNGFSLVRRGSDWSGGPSRVRSTFRGSWYSGHRDDKLGFRLAKTDP